MTAPSKAIVLCDFDGTITSEGTMDMLYKHYASCGTKYVLEWEQGKLSTMEEERLTFNCMHASREEMEKGLDKYMEIDPQTIQLAEYCRQKEYGFVILSEGQVWYIAYLLKKYDVTPDMIYGSEVTFNMDGSYDLRYPYHHSDYPKRATAKAIILKKYKEQGFYTIFIGDGLSDTDVVHFADKVYAKEPLLSYCKQHGIAAKGFTNFKGLLAQWSKEPPVK
ncbi:MAG: HAD-IB family phosphatase [Anaerolineaceae bacterium]|nr:HAD-IB family phosphatase [Anaerolineaceae bacterium]